MPDTTEAHEVGELLPCPLCGYGAEPEMDEDFETWGVRCGDYQCGCKIDGFVSKELARDTWNSRSVTSEAGVREAMESDTDGAKPRDVLWAMLRCANAWEPEVRILGNVRASDMRRAIEAALAASPAPASAPSRASDPYDDDLGYLNDPPGERRNSLSSAPSRAQSEVKRLIEKAVAEATPVIGGPEGETITGYTLSSGLWLMLQANVRNLIEALSRAPTIPSPAPAGAEVSDEQIDCAARYLRETQQAGKMLTPWETTPKTTKRKWLALAAGALRAAHGGQHEVK